VTLNLPPFGSFRGVGLFRSKERVESRQQLQAERTMTGGGGKELGLTGGAAVSTKQKGDAVARYSFWLSATRGIRGYRGHFDGQAPVKDTVTRLSLRDSSKRPRDCSQR